MSPVTAGQHGARGLPDGRRTALLDQLEQVVLAEGFVGLTVEDFAARLHCSKSTLYRVAPSKEQLVATIARHFFSSAAVRIERVVAEAPAPPQKLEAYLLNVGSEMARGTATFHEQMASHSATAALYRRNSQIAAERVRQLIHEGVESGHFDVADAEFAGQVVAAAITAIHLDDHAVPLNGGVAQAHANLSELVLYGVIGPSRGKAGATMSARNSAGRVAQLGEEPAA
jgi:AcrR family transcriptional regulator